jgi:hypothetical protein
MNILTEGLKGAITAVVAVMALLLYVILFGYVLRGFLTTPDFEINSNLVDFLTGLSAFVGGIVALSFGLKLPAPQAGAAPAVAGNGAPAPGVADAPAHDGDIALRSAAVAPAAQLESLGVVVATSPPHSPRSRLVMGLLYCLVWGVLGGAAQLVYLTSDTAPEVFGHIGSTFVGLFFPIAGSFFTSSNTT